MCKVLLVEDSDLQQLVVSKKLEKIDYEIDVDTVGTLEEAQLALADSCEYDLVILDLGLPDCQGIDTYLTLRKTCPLLPVIVYTAEDDFKIALECIKQGAETVLLKPDIEPLPRAVAFVLEKQKMRRRLERELQKQMHEVTCDFAEQLQTAKQTILSTAEQLGTATEEKRQWAEARMATNCG